MLLCRLKTVWVSSSSLMWYLKHITTLPQEVREISGETKGEQRNGAGIFKSRKGFGFNAGRGNRDRPSNTTIGDLLR